jgi:hypothetical protein
MQESPMTVTLGLSLEDVQFLREHLQRHIAEVDDELVHTERRDMRYALAQDVERLRRIENQLVQLLAS